MVNKDTFQKIKRSLIRHEGYKKFPYQDSVGKITIGIGYNLSDRGIKDQWIQERLEEDVEYFYKKLSEFPWFKDLNEARQIVLVDMSFMGWNHFLSFKKMISALEEGDYLNASLQMMSSKWADQVKDRAKNLSNGMLTGEYYV